MIYMIGLFLVALAVVGVGVVLLSLDDRIRELEGQVWDLEGRL